MCVERERYFMQEKWTHRRSDSQNAQPRVLGGTGHGERARTVVRTLLTSPKAHSAHLLSALSLAPGDGGSDRSRGTE